MYKFYRIVFILLIFLIFGASLAFGIVISPDGSLADWHGIKPIRLYQKENIVYNKPLWHGPKDLSANLYLYNTQRYLYIGIEVRDNSFIPAKGYTSSSILESDHIEIWIDTNPNRSVRYKMDQYVHQFIFSLNRQQKNCIELYPKKIFDIKSIRYAMKKIKGGYIFEAKIPGYLLKSPSSELSNIGLLVDIVDIDSGEKTQTGTFLSISPNRKWGNPGTFYMWHFSKSPLFTYKALSKVLPLFLYYANEKFIDISNDQIEDIVYYINYKDSSYVEVAYVSPDSLAVKKVFKYILPITNIVLRTITYNTYTRFFAIEGETPSDYPVLEVFKWEKSEKKLKNIGIIVSKGIDVYPVVKDIDKDGNNEIILIYKDGTRVYKYEEGRFVLTK